MSGNIGTAPLQERWGKRSEGLYAELAPQANLSLIRNTGAVTENPRRPADLRQKSVGLDPFENQNPGCGRVLRPRTSEPRLAPLWNRLTMTTVNDMHTMVKENPALVPGEMENQSLAVSRLKRFLLALHTISACGAGFQPADSWNLGKLENLLHKKPSESKPL